MKKTISLVLALVMVFAIASSASAITGLINPEATVTTAAPYYDIDLQLIEAVGTNLGVLSLQPVAGNKAYIFDGVVHFAVYFKTGASQKAISIDYSDYDNAYMLLSSDIVKFYNNSIQLYKITNVGVELITESTFKPVYDEDNKGNTLYNRVWVKLPDPTYWGASSFVMVGSGAVSVASNGTIQVDFLGDRNCAKFLDMPASIKGIADSVAFGMSEMGTWHPIFKKDSKVLQYNVRMGGSNTEKGEVYYQVQLWDAAGKEYIVEFYTDYDATVKSGSHNNVTKIFVLDVANNVYYRVNDTGIDLGGNGTSSTQFYKVTGNVVELVTEATLYAKLNAIYSEVMGAFKFNFSAEGVLIPQHFAYMFSTFHASDA